MTDFAARRTIMVDSQVRPSDVTKFPIIEAFLAIPREEFLPPAQREAAYVGENIPIAPGRVMLEPRTLAKMLDALNPQPGERGLDIGCGSGYSAALLSRLCRTVVAVEEVPALFQAAEAALERTGASGIALQQGALVAGAPNAAPFDLIVVQGAVGDVPEALLAQLKDGGRIGCLFMEGAVGSCRIGYRLDGGVTWRFAFNAGAPVLPGFERQQVFTL